MPEPSIGLTPRARKALQLAGKEAELLGHGAVGPEHILLGLLREGTGLASAVLEQLGVDAKELRAVIEKSIVPGEPAAGGGRDWAAKLTAAAREVLVSAQGEAERLDNNYIGQAHILLALVVCASMMPVERLPVASWQTALGLGFLSAVFDNIPLTALAIKQGGYDWGYLAYAVGFGGSMMWFGSSAGVALCGMYPQGRNVAQWLRHGWHVALAYVVGFAAMLMVIGFHPGSVPRGSLSAPSAVSASPS